MRSRAPMLFALFAVAIATTFYLNSATNQSDGTASDQSVAQIDTAQQPSDIGQRPQTAHYLANGSKKPIMARIDRALDGFTRPDPLTLAECDSILASVDIDETPVVKEMVRERREAILSHREEIESLTQPRKLGADCL